LSALLGTRSLADAHDAGDETVVLTKDGKLGALVSLENVDRETLSSSWRVLSSWARGAR